MATTAKKTVKAAYFGYKAFQAFRLLAGDITVFAELATEMAAETAVETAAELLVEGLSEAALEAAWEASAENVADLLDAAKDVKESMHDFDESMRDFKSFCNKLSKELGRDNPEAKELIDGAQELYQLFTDIDTDGSGTISRQELQDRFSLIGWSTQVANEQFDYLDTDRDGEITFAEFAKMLGPPPGRHEDASSFACKGRHPLRTHKWEDPRKCDWCQRFIPAQTKILVCITCDVNACHDCTAQHLESAAQRVTCKPRHGLVKSKIAHDAKTCNACNGHIPENATYFRCRGSCVGVCVCVGCVMNVPESLYLTGLRHVK